MSGEVQPKNISLNRATTNKLRARSELIGDVADLKRIEGLLKELKARED